MKRRILRLGLSKYVKRKTPIGGPKNLNASKFGLGHTHFHTLTVDDRLCKPVTISTSIRLFQKKFLPFGFSISLHYFSEDSKRYYF